MMLAATRRVKSRVRHARRRLTRMEQRDALLAL